VLEKLAQSCASVLGRNTTGTTLVGDVELTGVAAGAEEEIRPHPAAVLRAP